MLKELTDPEAIEERVRKEEIISRLSELREDVGPV